MSHSKTSTSKSKQPHLLEGWLASARKIPSPNFNQRPDGAQVSLLVIHNISLPPEQFGGEYIQQFFCNQLDSSRHPYFHEIAQLEVSSHFLVNRRGEILQFVSTEDRAWHAGQSHFEGRENCNDFSIGIELEGADSIPYTDVQYKCLVELAHTLMAVYPEITPQGIVGHATIAPERKTDPGPAFNWKRFYELLEQKNRLT